MHLQTPAKTNTYRTRVEDKSQQKVFYFKYITMAGLQLILLISLVSCASAFSLNNNRVSKPALSKVGNFVGKASPMMMASDAAPVDVVAAKEPPKKSFIDKIWNDQTQLMTYLAVWYMGNIYCKFQLLFLI